MGKKARSDYAIVLSERILSLAQNSGLTIPGLSELTNVSESHLYALLNGNKKITEKIADKLGKPFKIKGWQLINLDFTLSSDLAEAEAVQKFIEDHSENNEYFIETKNKNKYSYYIEYILLSKSIFKQPVYVWEILNYIEKEGKKISSKILSQTLHYLVKKGKLKSEKRPIKLQNGGYGSRIVDVFWNKDLHG